jgi:hypothetical protein
MPATHGTGSRRERRHAMPLTDLEGVLAIEPARGMRVRTRALSEFERDIRQLYLQMLDEPVPPHLLAILRMGLAARS